MEQTENAYEPVVGKPKGIRALCLDRRIILKLTFKNRVWRVWTTSRLDPVVEFR
jgi:hypothetical protein